MYKINGLIAISLFGLTACGGSGGGSSTVVADGVFKDSNVFGLAYESGGEKGVTDINGAFQYEEGEEVSFNIGTLNLGSGLGKSVMTPIDLVANGELATPEVINRARFLMMLDKDNMPSNGIEISSEVQEIAEEWPAVDFSADVFPADNANDIRTSASVADNVVHNFPDVETATAHLRTTLLCANAGAFVGSFTGDDEGNIALTVNPITGEVIGSTFNTVDDISAVLSSTTALDYDQDLEFVSSDDVGRVFAGMLDTTDAISGEWSSSLDESQEGDFSVSRLGGDSSAVYRYAVSFEGSDRGLFTFDLDDDNNITGTTYSVSTQEESPIEGTLEDNTLSATAEDGTRIDGVLDPETLSLSGVWSNVDELQAGSYVGGGCRLN